MLSPKAVERSKSSRGGKVVDTVELEIGQGEVVGLLGPNGAGKTTTFYILVGLGRPDSGRVLLNGDEITDLPMYLRARSGIDRKSTRLNSSHSQISYAVFCLKKKKIDNHIHFLLNHPPTSARYPLVGLLALLSL